MHIHINGEEREFPDGSTVADLLTALGTPRQGVAVALDGEVVRRANWAEVVVPDGARLEILTAVQGG
ncbi:thiamine biosynthesis protein ThiS [Prauserella sp. PE36]|uniref:Sulfur carrier protein ThiS n=1 Tax=Prauserella endophytica TaxID=1592324 RepID=A0ABY2RVL6_9PSEU|nr:MULTISPECIES: sulfur carrier protein ThiS [Prauserella]PXY37221.1 thiamine biosynthesis protein ThiS [Prauserella coralliicola]RBM10353.1 thiamine biosynthesis protein ThiS [Prauserella sp. PE36]TKG61089.1 sulfur carrier protein ThiS [Prauserella endophytica]